MGSLHVDNSKECLPTVGWMIAALNAFHLSGLSDSRILQVFKSSKHNVGEVTNNKILFRALGSQNRFRSKVLTLESDVTHS